MTAALVLSGDKGKGTVETPFGEMEVSVERFPHDPVAKTSEIAQKEEKNGTESELGHPEWPVEIRSDRISVSDIDGDLLLKGATLYTLEYVLDPVSLAPTFAPYFYFKWNDFPLQGKSSPSDQKLIRYAQSQL